MNVCWSSHISKTINKLNRLTSGLKFIRRRLTEEQFLKVLTSQYYGICYYGSPVWLGSHTRRMDMRKLTSVHYRLLRTTKLDTRRKIGRGDLDKIGRARPGTWAKYATANLVIKVLRDGVPSRVKDHLVDTLYGERRRKNLLKFYDGSCNKGGFQSIGNRLRDTFEEIKVPIDLTESNDALRLKLKKCFMINTKPPVTMIQHPKKTTVPST